MLDPKARRTALLLLLAGLLFRLWVMPMARFTGDESWFWATARNIATFKASASFGPAMTGSSANHPSPLFYYLMAIPQRLGPSPYWGSTFIALLHLAAFGLLFPVIARTRGPRLALLFLAVGAFAPWDVLYGDRVWLSCVVPFWGAMILRATLEAERPRWQGALVFFALTCPAVHMSAPLLWAGVLAALALGPRIRWSKRALAVGTLLAVLTYAAPIVSELSHDFANTRAILKEGGGHEPFDKVVATPLKVFGYAILYGSSEIGYHFGTGYWRPFDDGDAYLSVAGWLEHVRVHGPLFAILNLLSLLVSAFGFFLGVRELRSAFLARTTALRDDARILLVCAVGLVAGAALLVAATKSYFPHYTLLLMPALLLLPALALERLYLWRVELGVLITGLLMIAMLTSTARYYRTIDSKNGVGAVWSMAERLEEEPQPFALSFEGFYNHLAFELVGSTGLGKPLPIQDRASVRFRVHNGSLTPAGAALPPGQSLHRGVILERSPPAGP
ncbi:MAG: hypothetical protein U1E65_06385 [Myxococcota bacterium]